MSLSLIGKRLVGTFATKLCQNRGWATTRMFMSSTSLVATAPRGLRPTLPPPPAAAAVVPATATSFFNTTFHNTIIRWSAVPSSLQTPFNVLIMRCKNTLKTNKSIAKRLRPRGNRTLKRNKSGRSHNTGYKTRARKNRLGQSTIIKERKMEKKMQRCLGLR